MVANKYKAGDGVEVVWILGPASIGVAKEIQVHEKLRSIKLEFHVLGGLDVLEYSFGCFPMYELAFCTELTECSYGIGNVQACSEHEVH